MLDVRANAELLDTFDVCHRVDGNGMSTPRWKRVALPAAGGAIEQPARTMDALRLIEVISNEELAESMKETNEKSDG